MQWVEALIARRPTSRPRKQNCGKKTPHAPPSDTHVAATAISCTCRCPPVGSMDKEKGIHKTRILR